MVKEKLLKFIKAKNDRIHQGDYRALNTVFKS